MLKDIIKNNELNCSVEELQNYIDNFDISTIEVDIKKYTFDELYNGHQIKNEVNGKYYYTIKVGDIKYLQPFGLGEFGSVALFDDNVDEYINKQKEELLQNIILQKSIEYFKI